MVLLFLFHFRVVDIWHMWMPTLTLCLCGRKEMVRQGEKGSFSFSARAVFFFLLFRSLFTRLHAQAFSKALIPYASFESF